VIRDSLQIDLLFSGVEGNWLISRGIRQRARIADGAVRRMAGCCALRPLDATDYPTPAR